MPRLVPREQESAEETQVQSGVPGAAAGVSRAGQVWPAVGRREARQEVPQCGDGVGAQLSGAAGHGAAGLPHHHHHPAVQGPAGPRALEVSHLPVQDGEFPSAPALLPVNVHRGAPVRVGGP